MLLKIFIDKIAIGQRLDSYLASQLQGQYSRSQIQSFIKQNCVFVDDILIDSTNFKIKKEVNISIAIPKAIDAEIETQKIDLHILYEDNDIIVLNKQAGLVVHPGAGNYNGTLVNALLYHCKGSLSGIGGVKRPGIVHRLDKNTSGVMVVAKNDVSHVNLSAQFADHGKTGSLKRKYKAIIWGALEPSKGIINNYLARSNKDRTKRKIVEKTSIGAKHAVTYYETLQKYTSCSTKESIASLVECCLETGRTHQIRVHMAYCGAPLLGDSEYGSGFKSKSKKLDEKFQRIIEDFNRQALHAYFLQFSHPKTGKLMCFEQELPHDMANIVRLFENNKI